MGTKINTKINIKITFKIVPKIGKLKLYYLKAI